MKYTNKHLKESYKYSLCLLYIGAIGLVAGIVLLFFGFALTSKQMDNIAPLEKVLSEQSNSANKTAYIEIIKVPKKISENEHEGYYLVTTDSNTYISGMQEEQFLTLKKEVEEKGTARLEGLTKVIIDEQVLMDAGIYLNEDNIHIRVTELTYGNVLKEGYIVNLVLGGIITVVSVGLLLYGICDLKKYKNPQAKQINDECNHKNAHWLSDFQIYLTTNFIVTTYGGITAIDIGTVVEVNLYDTVKDNNTVRVLECRTNENKSVELYESRYAVDYVEEEYLQYLKEIFNKRNIIFNSTVETWEYIE